MTKGNQELFQGLAKEFEEENANKDFVVNVGGLIWALDWCPRGSKESHSLVQCEYLAVAVHPPDSSYHKIGEVLAGDGTVQIWCLYHEIEAAVEAKVSQTGQRRARGRPRKKPVLGEAAPREKKIFSQREGQHVPPTAPTVYDNDDVMLLPRLALCLSHDGKVTWDLKWRPYDACNPGRDSCMGFIAVLLGNGSLQVWEVPSIEGGGGGSIKLQPVFRSSRLMRDGRQSVPLSLEWSPVAPHEFILVGCHDGSVALWRFKTVKDACTDTRPLLCFNADTLPIRAVGWAPNAIACDSETANVIATAGHEGVKFWDVRDPFRPLWHVYLPRKCVNGFDWLSNPRCLLLCLDDGTLRILSLANASYDVPVTGEPFAGTQQQGLSTYCCSSFAIWSVQVSRKSATVAYCGADGSTFCFELTSRAVERDPLRNRAPHFLCGSLTQNGNSVTVNSWTDMQRPAASVSKATRESGDQLLEWEKTRAFPVKVVAMYRVRWNMNDGSERWLCYGGAAGLLRFHEIDISSLRTT